MRSLRWRRNRRFVVLFGAGFVVLTLGFGNTRLAPFVSTMPADHSEPAAEAEDIEGSASVFDEGFVHEITISFDQAAYERMVADYKATGDKSFIEASITIDGTTMSSVGIRLKGNSTLRGLAGGGQRGGAGGGLAAATSFGEPSRLPWLVSFDEYVKGQRYQGYEELALRPVTSISSAINEALALELVAVAGEPSQKWMYTTVSVNGANAVLRLAVEVPMGEFADDNFENDGVLYKSLSTGHFTYLGEDPLAYDDAFTQVTLKKQQDLKPLIDLLRWVSEASDEEFAANLAQHVEVESLARYLALQSLLGNFDDMGGPGQNYYLWYDRETGKFTIISWDMNLALSPFGRILGGAGGGGQAGGQGAAPAGGRQGAPAGGAPAGGVQNGVPVAGGPAGGGPANPAAGGRGPLGGNALKDRFLASPAFADLYAAARAEVYDAIYASGADGKELTRILALLGTRPELYDPDVLDTQAKNLRSALQTQADTAGVSLPR